MGRPVQEKKHPVSRNINRNNQYHTCKKDFNWKTTLIKLDLNLPHIEMLVSYVSGRVVLPVGGVSTLGAGVVTTGQSHQSTHHLRPSS